jgi:hypothetical protein
VFYMDVAHAVGEPGIDCGQDPLLLIGLQVLL